MEKIKQCGQIRDKELSNRVTMKKFSCKSNTIYTNMYNCEITTYVYFGKIRHTFMRTLIIVLKSILDNSFNLGLLIIRHPNVQFFIQQCCSPCAKLRSMFIFGNIWHALIRMLTSISKNLRGRFFSKPSSEIGTILNVLTSHHLFMFINCRLRCHQLGRML